MLVSFFAIGQNLSTRLNHQLVYRKMSPICKIKTMKIYYFIQICALQKTLRKIREDQDFEVASLAGICKVGLPYGY